MRHHFAVTGVSDACDKNLTVQLHKSCADESNKKVLTGLEEVNVGNDEDRIDAVTKCTAERIPAQETLLKGITSGMLGGVGSQGFETLSCMLAPLGTRHIVTRIKHVLAARFTQSARVVLEKLNQSAAVHADDFINIVQLPIP